MKALIGSLAVAALIAVAGWWQFYKYQQCKHVGFSTLYCSAQLFSR